jgi:polynucleotide 5'-kinase involved in rRNA processing
MPSYDLLECFERYIKLMEKWLRKAKEEMDYCLVDSNGDIREALKLRELEILNPDLVVALQRGSELEPILANLESRILRLSVSEEVKHKSWEQRKEIRSEKLKLYFEDSSARIVKCESPFDFTHRIVGLYSEEKFLGLGLAKDRDAGGLKVMTPVGAKVNKVEFSSIKFDEVSW